MASAIILVGSLLGKQEKAAAWKAEDPTHRSVVGRPEFALQQLRAGYDVIYVSPVFHPSSAEVQRAAIERAGFEVTVTPIA